MKGREGKGGSIILVGGKKSPVSDETTIIYARMGNCNALCRSSSLSDGSILCYLAIDEGVRHGYQGFEPLKFG